MLLKKKAMKLLVFFVLISTCAIAQSIPYDSLSKDTTEITRLQVYESFDVPRNFKGEYRIALQRVRRVYPLALHAAEIIDSLDRVLEDIDRKRKQKRLARQTKKELMTDFKFVIKDLYVSEGKVLTKLIYRETGMTVREIIKKYKNGFEAFIYDGMAKIFEQNLDATYHPLTEDFVIECVVQDLLSGKVEFDPTFTTINRAEFRESKKETRERRKRNKQIQRERKKAERKLKKSNVQQEGLVEKKNPKK